MDTDRIAELLRGLRTTPSRRAVATAAAALAVSTPLAPLFGWERAAAKGKGHKKNKKKHKKKNNPKDLIPPPCAFGEIACNNDPFACCAPNLCSSTCGCCPATQPTCCGDATTVNRLCFDPTAEACCPRTVTGLVGACPKQTFCALGAGGLIPVCCPSGAEPCGGGCCSQGTFCCPGLMMCCVDSGCNTSVGACGAIAGGTLARIA